MNLKSYFQGRPRGAMTELAHQLSIAPVYLSQLASRQDGREPSPALCVQIGSLTSGEVTRWDLRPNDWWLIWPELIGSPGAPDQLPPVVAEKVEG